MTDKPVQEKKSKEYDSTRLLSLLSGVHSSSRDIAIIDRKELLSDLSLVVYEHIVGGTLLSCAALVYDNGEQSAVFRGE